MLIALREALRRREIRVEGAGRWRDPDEDLLGDFDDNRDVHYGSIEKPSDAEEFTADLKRRHCEALYRLDTAMAEGTTGGVRDARDPRWWREATATASGSKRFGSWESNLMTIYRTTCTDGWSRSRPSFRLLVCAVVRWCHAVARWCRGGGDCRSHQVGGTRSSAGSETRYIRNVPSGPVTSCGRLAPYSLGPVIACQFDASLIAVSGADGMSNVRSWMWWSGSTCRPRR